jgi:DNA-binding NarL/FixJ family response regulator
MEKIRVLIADDHAQVRTFLAARLGREEDIEVVGEAASSSQAVEYSIAAKPHVILMDPMMRDGRGLEALKQIRGYLPATMLVVLTAFVDTSLQIELRKIGVPQILVKGLETNSLVDILRSAAANPRTN